MKKLILISCTTAAMFLAGSAQATIQEDIALCRAAFFDQTNKSIDDYRLKFDSKKGNRVRRLQIIAIPKIKSVGSKFGFSCQINKNQVTDITLDIKDA